MAMPISAFVRILCPFCVHHRTDEVVQPLGLNPLLAFVEVAVGPVKERASVAVLEAPCRCRGVGEVGAGPSEPLMPYALSRSSASIKVRSVWTLKGPGPLEEGSTFCLGVRPNFLDVLVRLPDLVMKVTDLSPDVPQVPTGSRGSPRQQSAPATPGPG